MNRRLLGAAVLGLLSSLIAHEAMFGGSHAMGGAFSQALLESAAVFGAGFLAVLALASLLLSKETAVGSVLARRTAQWLPHFPGLVLSAALWFTIGERLEPEHAGPGGFVIVAALAVSALLVLAVARGFVRALADAVLAVVAPGHALRHLSTAPKYKSVLAPHEAPQLRRRFVRPPPSITAA